MASPTPTATARRAILRRLRHLFLPKMGCVGGKEILTEEDKDYIAQNTAATREEIDQQHENFLQKHPDGKISKKDFSVLMRQCYPTADTDKLEKHIFRMYDANNDGKIDFKEFMVVLYVMSNGSAEENLRQIFRIFDINSDGTISQKELQKIVKDLFHLLKKDGDPAKESEEFLAETAFKEMDEDRDGKVTIDEFVGACMKQEKFTSLLALRIIDVFVTD